MCLILTKQMNNLVCGGRGKYKFNVADFAFARLLGKGEIKDSSLQELTRPAAVAAGGHILGKSGEDPTLSASVHGLSLALEPCSERLHSQCGNKLLLCVSSH